MLEKQQNAVVMAMQYMTEDERAVLVSLAESYANERMNKKARFIVAPSRTVNKALSKTA